MLSRFVSNSWAKEILFYGEEVPCLWVAEIRSLCHWAQHSIWRQTQAGRSQFPWKKNSCKVDYLPATIYLSITVSARILNIRRNNRKETQTAEETKTSTRELQGQHRVGGISTATVNTKEQPAQHCCPQPRGSRGSGRHVQGRLIEET